MCAGNNVSIKVEVDPGHPKMLPECCLLGAEHGGYDLQSVFAGSARAHLQYYNPKTNWQWYSMGNTQLSGDMHVTVTKTPTFKHCFLDFNLNEFN